MVTMSIEDSKLTRIAAYARSNGLKFAAEVAFNFVLPFAVYSLTSERIGGVPAMIAASVPPILWSIALFIRERKLDAISMVVLAGIALSLVAFAGGGGVKFLQLREHLVGGVVGLTFLGSAAIGRPLIFYLAQAGARRRGALAAGVVDSLKHDVGFRRAALLTTLAWGVGLTALCALNTVLVFALSIKLFLLVNGPIGYATLGLLTAWTYWYLPRQVRQALVRSGASPAA